MAKGTGEIHADAVYAKAPFMERTGMQQAGFDAAKANGLKVIYAHSRVFIRGYDWISYLDRISRQVEEPTATETATA